MIQLDNISVTFGCGTPLQTSIFKNLNLKIHNGDFVTVIGGNGAGKSTLLNVIAGEIKVDAGSILLGQEDVTKWPAYERAQYISRVFQDPLLGSFADLSIEENLSVAFNRTHMRSLKPALNNGLRRIFRDRLAEIGIGLEDRLTDKIGLLSGGQRQAVSLIMATLQPSKILLLDEHTAALDPKMEQLILELTSKLIAEHNLTALMITHCMSQALEYGTRTIALHHGKIMSDLSGEERINLKPKDLIPYF